VSDLTGEVIDGRYQLLELIASGGMASIYKATDLRLDRHVAVKIMHPHLANDEDFVNRFIREAKATAALSHPNVVSIQDQGWNEGGAPAVFIVMEYIDGFTLRDLLVDHGPLSIDDFLRYMVPVTSALAEAHRLGINHRDLKPENILISKDGRIKIADFGLAQGGVVGNTMTAESSIVLGSVSYLSPEQVQRGISDARSDIYSLGVVFFELLTGEKPYEGESPIQIAYKHVNERIGAPSSRRPGIPEALDKIVMKATSPNPDERQKNGAELLEDLRQLQVTIDPKRKQMSLELDLPLPPSTRKKKRAHAEVRIGNTIVERIKSSTEPIRPDFTKAQPKEEAMSKTDQIRRKTSRRVRRNRILAFLLITLLAVGGWYKLSGPGAGISIPSVAGMSKKDATSTLSALGIKATVGSQNYDPSIPAGEVISSDPGGGGHVKKGGTVSLTISQGQQPVPTPTPIPTPTPTPTATATATPTPSPISIASYINKSGDQAQSELTAVGLTVKQTFGFSDTVAAGNVMSQNPDGSAPVDAGSTINIVISQGSSLVYIPNIYSLSRSAASTALENLQLKVVIRKIGNGKHVTNVSPKVGTQVKRGSTVVITLG